MTRLEDLSDELRRRALEMIASGECTRRDVEMAFGILDHLVRLERAGFKTGAEALTPAAVIARLKGLRRAMAGTEREA